MVQKTDKIKIYADVVEAEAMDQFYKAMALPCNIQGALMPDTHTGYTLPIGAVVKSVNRIFPAYIGYDIGCGMCAVKTDLKAEWFTEAGLKLVRDLIVEEIPLGPNKHKSPVSIPLNIATMDMTEFAADILIGTGKYQLGTLGGGNHFIEIGEDKDGYVNIVIHSGSRGVGFKIAEHYMREACVADVDEARYEREFDDNPKNIAWYKSKKCDVEKYEAAKKEFVYRRTRARVNTNTEGHYSFDINSERGKDYIKDMNMALDFALENRRAMINVCLKALATVYVGKVETSRFINRNHNHAEIFNSSTLGSSLGDVKEVVHRKGATHAEEGMMGVIPGNMKEGSFIVRGKGNADSMSSSSHGAGRVLSRRKAKEQLDLEDFHKEMEGVVTNHTDATLDEAPKAYKDIYKVMELQEDLVEVVDQVKPIINIKG